MVMASADSGMKGGRSCSSVVSLVDLSSVVVIPMTLRRAPCRGPWQDPERKRRAVLTCSCGVDYRPGGAPVRQAYAGVGAMWCQWPRGLPHRRPADLPSGGHENSPLADSSPPRLSL